MSGKRGGDPAKLPGRWSSLAGENKPPVRWAAGADVLGTLEQKGRDLLAQADAYRELSSSLGYGAE